MVHDETSKSEFENEIPLIVREKLQAKKEMKKSREC